ncbi:MAG: ABC transporter substrate-binding protein [Pseudomonadales bacterium]|nr:ABC transporter substrate-binding protein [Pseudomonadales bacterium]
MQPTLLLLVVSQAFAQGESTSLSSECVDDYVEGFDYFPEKAQLDHALGFQLTYHLNYKVLTVQSPLATTEDVADVMVLVQCGTPAPSLEGEIANATVITVPAKSIGSNDDLALNRARTLGATDRIVAVGGSGIYATEVRQRWESEAAVAIGESFHGQPDYEKLLAVAPDVLFLSSASLARAESLHRARSLGLSAVPSMSWMEPTALGQAEWLQVVAAFLNEESRANSILATIKDRYQELSSLAQAQTSTPLVVWLDPATQRGQWVVPESNWLATIITDAGGRTPWTNSQGAATRIVTTEQILGLSGDVRALVTTTVSMREPRTIGGLMALPAIRDSRLFDVHRRSRPEHNAYDWYESAVIEADKVLEDFIALLHPDLLPGHEFRHLRPILVGTEGSESLQ